MTTAIEIEDTDPLRYYTRIVNECFALARQWQWFKSAYFEQAAARTWHGAANATYHLLARAVERDTVLQLMRLMDGHQESDNRKCVSIPQLIFEIYGTSVPDQVLNARNGWEEHHRAYETSRNKCIAHLDKRMAFAERTLELPVRNSMDTAIKSLVEILKSIALERHWTDWSSEILHTDCIKQEWVAFVDRLERTT